MAVATIESLQEKILDGHVVNREEALNLFKGSELNDLGAIAEPSDDGLTLQTARSPSSANI